ncbi:MAG: hypothetical protein WB988_05765 [Candidatus Nitrosopolaris sp.]
MHTLKSSNESYNIAVSTVNWDKLGNDTSTQIQHWTTNADITNVHSLFTHLEFLLVAAWDLGF